MKCIKRRLRRLSMAELFWKTDISVKAIARDFKVAEATVHRATRQYPEDTDFDSVRTALNLLMEQGDSEKAHALKRAMQKLPKLSPPEVLTGWRREYDNLLRMISWGATLQEMANEYNVSLETVRQGLRTAGLTETFRHKKILRRQGAFRLTKYHPNDRRYCSICHVGFAPKELTSESRCRSCNRRRLKEWREAHPERLKDILLRSRMRAATVQLTCDNPGCRRAFSRDQNAINRRRKLGQKRFYCSRSCATRHFHQLGIGIFSQHSK